MGSNIDTYKTVVRKSAGKRPHGIPTYGWKRNIKMGFIIEC